MACSTRTQGKTGESPRARLCRVLFCRLIAIFCINAVVPDVMGSYQEEGISAMAGKKYAWGVGQGWCEAGGISIKRTFGATHT